MIPNKSTEGFNLFLSDLKHYIGNNINVIIVDRLSAQKNVSKIILKQILYIVDYT